MKPSKCCKCNNPVRPSSPVSTFMERHFNDQSDFDSNQIIDGTRSQTITVEDSTKDGMLLEFRFLKGKSKKTVDFYITCKKCGETCIYEYEV